VAPSPRSVSARELAERLLPVARQGLVSGGVEAAEADAWLGLFAGRVANGITGAVWQRNAYARAREQHSPREALGAMLERYLALSQAHAPVHTWT
jgi:uncharacterized protein YgfB (UPF0149 family)